MSVATKPLLLNNCARELPRYDARMMEVDAGTFGALTDDDVWYWAAHEENALWDLREAFWRDTKDRNSRANAHLVGPSYIRELLAKYPPEVVGMQVTIHRETKRGRRRG